MSLLLAALRVASAALVTLAALAPCHGGIVRTRDGKTHEGTILLREGNKLLVTRPGGAAVEVKLEDLVSADFKAVTPQRPAAAPEGSQKPDDERVQGGFTAEFFSADSLTGLAAVRTDPAIDFHWHGQGPDPEVPADHFSARWTARLTPPLSGEYTFHLAADDGVRLWIDERLVIDQWHPHNGPPHTGTAALAANKAVDVRLEYYQVTGPAIVKLEWSAPGLPRQLIPAQHLRPATRPTTVPASGTGLVGWYYSDAKLETLNMVRARENIDFAWAEKPDPTVGQTGFSVRWVGQVEPKFTERYTFHLMADDGCRLWIDGKPVIDDWRLAAHERSGAIDLVAGQKVDLKLEYFQGPSAATARLFWSSPRQPRQIVPITRLYPPGDVALNVPAIRLIPPPKPEGIVGTQPLTLTAELFPADVPLAKVEFLCDKDVIGTATARPWRFKWDKPVAGEHYLLARATLNRVNGPVRLSSYPVSVRILDAAAPPAPWLERTVGDSGAPGSASYRSDNGTMTLKTAGQLMWTHDAAFHYVHQPLKGDGQIIARVRAIAPPRAGALAGVAIFERPDPRARQAVVGFVPGVGWVYLRRTAGWGEVRFTERPVPEAAAAASPLPGYVKLVRRGNVLSGYISADGASWQAMFSENMDLPPDALIGVLASSGEKGAVCTATLDQIQLTLSAGEPPLPRGVQLVDGSLIAGDFRGVSDERGLDDARGIPIYPPRGGERLIPPRSAARILLHPLPPARLEGIPRDTPGVLLNRGDFFPGEIRRARDGQVTVSSVLFGLKSFPWHEVAAIALRDVVAVDSAPYEVRTADGSVHRVSTIVFRNDGLALPAAPGPFTYPSGEITLIRARGPDKR